MKRGGGGEFWRQGDEDESLKTGGQERGEVCNSIPNDKSVVPTKKETVSNLRAAR